ncbi:hypothetical protein BKA69DRAFT_180703 [Paraphysoderma sedebokerense]|nr:hypothetical protein BKA69DRAFT_180703 [Paraphysoderma sedebokerense]
MKRSNIGASPNDNYKKQRFSNYSKQSVVSQPPQAYGSHQQNYNKPSQPYGGNYGLGNAAPNLASAASSSSDIYNPYAPGPTYGNTGYAAPSYFQPGNAYSNNSYMNTLASGAYGTATFNGYGAVGMNSLGGGMNNVGPAMGGLAAGSFVQSIRRHQRRIRSTVYGRLQSQFVCWIR